MKEMRFEFKISLKKVWYKTRIPKAPKERKMNLRKSLILAYQIQEYIETKKVKSMLEFGKLVNMSQGRICQIMKLLLLAPTIQEEIILNDSKMIESLSERCIKNASMEVNWKKQMEIWKMLY